MFYSRNYSSSETYDIAKFLNFDTDVYDVINSQILLRIKELPTTRYYNVNEGSREIDNIANQVYGSPFLAFYIQYYNDINEETLPEDAVLKLFSMDDFTTMCNNLLTGENSNEN